MKSASFKFKGGDLIIGGEQGALGRVIAQICDGEEMFYYKIFWIDKEKGAIEQFRLYERDTIETFYEVVK